MWRRKERKKNNHKNSGHFVPLQRLRAAHALLLDQNCMKMTTRGYEIIRLIKALSESLSKAENLVCVKTEIQCFLCYNYLHKIYLDILNNKIIYSICFEFISISKKTNIME